MGVRLLCGYHRGGRALMAPQNLTLSHKKEAQSMVNRFLRSRYATFSCSAVHGSLNWVGLVYSQG
jgi:hypothetical protein